MAIRESIQRHPRAALLVSMVVIVTVLGYAFASYRKSAGGTEIGQYFTCDDGATYFVDDSDPVPPFDYKGKQAVLAHIARQDSGTALQVIYMERFTPEARVVAQKIRTRALVSTDESHLLATGHEYKAPGEAQWRTFTNDMDRTYWAHDLAQKQGCAKSGFVDPS